MKQLTIRGFDAELERRLRAAARERGTSLSQAALTLLRTGAGLQSRSQPPNVVGSSLDHLAGTWSERDADAFFAGVADLERIDAELWRTVRRKRR